MPKKPVHNLDISAALEDSLISYKAYLDVNIWQLQAFINKDALEDDDYIDND